MGGKEAQTARLAAALRANLRRRKAQARGAAAGVEDKRAEVESAD